MNDDSLKVGSNIIRFGKAWKISRIVNKKSSEGSEEKTLFYQALFQKNDNNAIFSIPFENIDKTHIRYPISKEKAKELLESLKQSPDENFNFDLLKSKEKLALNDFDAWIEVLKQLWWTKNRQGKDFTSSKNEAFQLAKTKICEEIACVFQSSLTEAKALLQQSLIKTPAIEA